MLLLLLACAQPAPTPSQPEFHFGRQEVDCTESASVPLEIHADATVLVQVADLGSSASTYTVAAPTAYQQVDGTDILVYCTAGSGIIISQWW
jgi:hypothetical protein